MEKIWKKASQNEYQKLFDILNSQSLMEKETFKNFAIELFEIAKKQLGCVDCKLKFIDDERNNLGFASIMDNSVTLNLRKMDKNTLHKTVSTIYHELTHIHQDTFKNNKTIGTSIPAEFPFIRCFGDERFLPREILGISPFLFYYTCQHEKQARDNGSECAMELFDELKKLAQTSQAKSATIRQIDRTANQVKLRWEKENEDNAFANSQIQAFLSQNPNFVQEAFNKIKQEFNRDVKMYNPMSKERFALENRFNCRLGSLVLLGCDDKLKEQIFDFVSSNFVSKGEVFNTFISVIDSPYSKTTEEELSLLFKLAEQNKCSPEVLSNLLISWDKNFIKESMDKSSNQSKNKFSLFNNIGFEK